MAGTTRLRGQNRQSGFNREGWSLAAGRGALFAMIWWVLAEGDTGSWRMGAPCVLIAVLALIALSPRRVWRLRPLGVIAFIPFFLRRTVIGSVDVAWRALHPRMPIDPDLVYYRLRFPAGPGRLLFVSAVNLLPGTVGAEFEGDSVVIHVMDRQRPHDTSLESLERRVAAMLAPEPGEPG